MTRAVWPVPADFAAPPIEAERRRWDEADRAARPARRDRVRARFAEAGIDAYFGVRREHMRYLTGFALANGEEKVAGSSGQFLLSDEHLILFADSRYEIQATREAPEASLETVYGDLPSRWPELVASIGAKRVGVEAALVPQATWMKLAAAAPDVELVPIEGWIEADRATKEPAELERVAAACAVGDRALATLLPEIRPGVTEAELALRLEWLMRTSGAEALPFDVACLAGPEAALPHGAPGDRPVIEGAVLLFDFGAQVEGYASDMTRTLFVGEPSGRDQDLYALVKAAQTAAIDAVARGVIGDAGYGERFGHSLGHGIGLATHEAPTLSRRAAETPLPSPTVFSVEPGIYIEGETGIRIEDLVTIDVAAGRLERLTHFPSDVVVVGNEG